MFPTKLVLVSLAILSASGCAKEEQRVADPANVATAPSDDDAPPAPSDDDAPPAPSDDDALPADQPSEAPVASAPATPPRPSETAPTKPGAPARAADAPQNLKILPKSWSRAEVEAFMKQNFARGLGVQCSFCHDTSDFSADTNHHKEIARDMMRMTRKLNASYFGGEREISCFTCHQGQKEPAQ